MKLFGRAGIGPCGVVGIQLLGSWNDVWFRVLVLHFCFAPLCFTRPFLEALESSIPFPLGVSAKVQFFSPAGTPHLLPSPAEK